MSKYRLFVLSIVGAAFAVAGNVLPARAQAGGSGWTQIYPHTIWNGDLPESERYSKSGTTEHFWVHSTDPHGPTGSGSRSEFHVNYSYTSGSAQFQGNFRAERKTNAFTVMQVFGRPAGTGATALQLQVRGNNGELRRYNDEIVANDIWTVFHRINVIHNTATGIIDVYDNGTKKGSFGDGGKATHWFKYGDYDTASATAYTGCYWQDVKIFTHK